MTPQGLQIRSPKDSLARLRIVTNDIVIVNIVFRICIAHRRRMPMRIQGLMYLFLFHGVLQSWFSHPSRAAASSAARFILIIPIMAAIALG